MARRSSPGSSPFTKVLDWQTPWAQVVRRRPAQPVRQLPRPAPRDARQQGRAALGGRARRQSARSPTPSCTPRSAASPTCSRGSAGRRRSRRDLHADDPRGGGRHAGLRAHRRDALGGLRRLLGRGAARPHQRLRRQGHASPPTAASGAASSSRSRTTSTRRSRETPTVETCVVVRRTGNAVADAGRPRRLVARPHGAARRRDCAPRGARRRAPAVHPLHVGHDRQAQGRRAHHRRLPAGRAPHDQVRLRSARRRRLLVHRRHRLGHRPQLRRLRPAVERRHQRDVRRRARLSRQGPLLGDHRAAQGHHLLHGADRDPRLHALGRRVPEEARSVVAAPARHRRRADQPRSVDVVPARSSAASAARSSTPGGRPRRAPS